MSKQYGDIRISKSPNMSNAYTIPGCREISVDSNDWNASADRGTDRIRIEFLGFVYTLKFVYRKQTSHTVFQSISSYTRGLEFYVEYFNPEQGKRVVMRVYRSATSYKYIGEGNEIWEEVPYEWIGVYTQR